MENNQCDIRIDKDGIWYFHGVEMIRKEIVGYFYQYLKYDGNGNYCIEIENDHCYVAVEDVPYIIKSVAIVFSQNDLLLCIEIYLSDGSNEKLNLDTPLRIGNDNVLYCGVKRGEYEARFSRPAYYQLCEHIDYDSEKEKYFITLGHHSYPLNITQTNIDGGSYAR